jgi:hypothetical protein
VYDVPVFSLWNLIASASVQCPRIDADIVLAAESPFANAKCTPEEKNGSICFELSIDGIKENSASTHKSCKINHQSLKHTTRREC